MRDRIRGKARGQARFAVPEVKKLKGDNIARCRPPDKYRSENRLHLTDRSVNPFANTHR